MKRTIIQISTAFALVLLMPNVGVVSVKADDAAAVGSTNQYFNVKGTIMCISLLSDNIRLYTIQDEDTGEIYSYSINTDLLFNLGDKVLVCMQKSPKIIIRDVVRR